MENILNGSKGTDNLLLNCMWFEPKGNLNESFNDPDASVIVQGVLQRANAKNQNGRVYPKDILEREVAKYDQNFVKERRALGELDHPDCERVGTEILTDSGWKDLRNVMIGDLVPTLNTITNTIEYNPIERVINEPYKGKMISIVGKNIDTMVTPNHRFILKNKKNEFVEKTSQELLDISKITKNPHLSIPIAAENWEGLSYDVFKSHAIHLDFRFIKIEEVDYDDTVHCVTVKNGTFYCRDRNKAFWTGNSSVVNLQNVSHNVLEMVWNGDDLVGKIEILPTPNGNILKQLLKTGIRLGISSRGLGSVRKNVHENTDEVQDDFELLAFDFVSNPSTRGAFMGPSGKLSEGINHNTVKSSVTYKWYRIEEIIRNILSECKPL